MGSLMAMSLNFLPLYQFLGPTNNLVIALHSLEIWVVEELLAIY